jgi:hypothetical protein
MVIAVTIANSQVFETLKTRHGVDSYDEAFLGTCHTMYSRQPLSMS